MVPSLEALETRTLPSFLPPILYDAPLSTGRVAVGDFNSDQRLDLLGANIGLDPRPLRLWLGNGDGTLQVPPRNVMIGQGMWSLGVEDFNGDGKLDVAVTTTDTPHGGGRGVHVLLGGGDGVFSVGHSRDPGGVPSSLAAGDFNGDGRLDLAVTLAFSGDVRGGIRVLRGNGDGSFMDVPIRYVDRQSQSAAVGDFNTDGRLDLGFGPNQLPELTIIRNCDLCRFQRGTYAVSGRLAAST